MADNISLFASAPKGLEALLATELIELGASTVKQTRAGVAFQGSLALAYRACLWTRLANRILLPLADFVADDQQTLYQGIQEIAWDQHFMPDATLAIDFNGNGAAVNHTQFGAQRCKDAIVDQFMQKYDSRPSVDLQHPDIRINVYMNNQHISVYLDLSGDSLHRREYRDRQVVAPLKENLAAGILLRAGWPMVAKQGGPLVDPLCGSATLLIEAALIASDTAPGLKRQRFGFLNWKQHQADIWQELLSEAQDRHTQGLKNIPTLLGYDSDSRTVEIAQDNITRAGFSDYISIKKVPLGSLPKSDFDSLGLVITNPPYGVRLGEPAQLAKLYTLLGDKLKENFLGWSAAVFTSDQELGKCLGLRARHMYSFYNGALPCKLLCFGVNPQWYMRHPGGAYNIATPLPAKDLGENAQMLNNRLLKNYKHLKKWAKKENIQCYRIYDADLPEYAFSLDLYQGETRWAQMHEYKAPPSIDKNKARHRIREALGIIPAILDISQDQLFYKLREQQKGAKQYDKQQTKTQFHSVYEGGLKFQVNFTNYIDNGLFLDHRLTRQLIRELAKDKQVLNLFSYTGSISVYAAAGGAASVTSIDLSKTYMEWCKENFKINNIDLKNHSFIREDCLEWIKRPHPSRKYDLIFLDPPTFSNSKKMENSFDIQRDHADLIRMTMQHLATDGLLIFSNNFRKFKMEKSLFETYSINDITKRTLAKDFTRSPKIHNCWEIRNKEQC